MNEKELQGRLKRITVLVIITVAVRREYDFGISEAGTL